MALEDILRANKQYAASFDRPLPLHATKRLSVVTCMDSRLMLSKMLGLDIGEAEIIRNAGGRVTPDVVRSLFVAQELPELSTREVIIIHHTDCGAQAAERHFDELVVRMRELLGSFGGVMSIPSRLAGVFIPGWLRRWWLSTLMRTFKDPVESVRSDVRLLRNAPLFPRHIPVHGLVYGVTTGKLEHVVTSAGQFDKKNY